MTLLCETALDQYFREHVKKKCAAPIRVEYAIESLNSFFEGTPIGDVDIPLCREYREHREDVSDSTVRRELGVLQAAANHAVRWRRLTLALMPSVELPPEGVSKRVWLFKPELSSLLEVAEQNDRRVFRFCQIAYHTGSRKQAVELLTWPQVDLKARRIDLQGDLPRSKKRRPIVPISETMCAELEIMKSKAINQWVLGSPDNIRPAFDRIATASKLANLPNQGLREAGRLTPHILRHSRATHLLQDGKSPWAVANLLGDTLPTVLRVYGHCCPNYLEEAIL